MDVSFLLRDKQKVLIFEDYVSTNDEKVKTYFSMYIYLQNNVVVNSSSVNGSTAYTFSTTMVKYENPLTINSTNYSVQILRYNFSTISKLYHMLDVIVHKRKISWEKARKFCRQRNTFLVMPSEWYEVMDFVSIFQHISSRLRYFKIAYVGLLQTHVSLHLVT